MQIVYSGIIKFKHSIPEASELVYTVCLKPVAFPIYNKYLPLNAEKNIKLGNKENCFWTIVLLLCPTSWTTGFGRSSCLVKQTYWNISAWDNKTSWALV